MVKKEDVLLETEFGKAVILHYYPQSAVGFSSRKNFKLRGDDRNPSTAVFMKDNCWFIQDKGGSDNKAYSAISLVMEQEGLKFPQALEWIASKFAPHLLGEKVARVSAKPNMKKASPIDEIRVNIREDKLFTDKELILLGFKITQTICDIFDLKPVSSYITKKNAKGESWEIISTDDYPIYYYDYGKWGKLYQPLGEIRFLYVGEKPADFLFSEKYVAAKFKAGLNGQFPAPEDKDDPMINDERLREIVICSGASDALNVYAAGYHVCWPNSESEEISPYYMSILFRIAQEVFVLYDMDATGLRNAYNLALKHLDLRLILLPDDLKTFPARGGKYCKDAKDFMVHYRKHGKGNPHKLFEAVIKTSGALKFWIVNKKSGGGSSYDIDNIPLYNFLSANGFHRIHTTSNRKGYTFCHIQNHVVELINEDAISSRCSTFLIDFLRENTEYYSPGLIRQIVRSKQVNLSSLDKLRIIELDFVSYGRSFDHFFFKNAAARVTAAGVEVVKSDKCEYYVYKHKILDHNIKVEKPLFDISYTQKYQVINNKLASATPRSPEFFALKKELDALPHTEKFKLEIFNPDFSFLKYLYNTGRLFWRKEEMGYELTDEEKNEVSLNFINKVVALGYQLSKFKDAALAYGIYAMEMEQSDEGSHLGGTGKSLYISSIEQMRKQLFVNGQDINQKDSSSRFLFSGVEKDITDHVFFDDLNQYIEMHRFMPMITGKMTVDKKYLDAFILDYKDSPRVGFTSNHAIRKFDASLRRRTWFTAFSDYYHPEDPMRNLKECSPYTEFGKNLIFDYTPEEMNTFYNFMMQCLAMYLKFKCRIQPPMKRIEMRNLQRALTDEFIWWAEDYFQEERLDCEVNKHEAFEAYKLSISKKVADMIKMKTFTGKLIQFCQYKEWVYNPTHLLISQTEKERNEIRRKVDGTDTYFFYLSTIPVVDSEDTSSNMDSDKPPFG